MIKRIFINKGSKRFEHGLVNGDGANAKHWEGPLQKRDLRTKYPALMC